MNVTIINQPRVVPYKTGYQIAKRAMDLMLCLLILPIALPVIAICALAIYLDSSGPAFFVQERIGKGGRRFWIYKFRTMQYNVDDSHHRTFMKAFVRGQIGSRQDVNSYSRAFVKAFVNKPVPATPIRKFTSLSKPHRSPEWDAFCARPAWTSCLRSSTCSREK